MEYKIVEQEIKGVTFRRKYVDQFIATEVEPDFNEPQESMYAVVMSSLISDKRFTPAEKIVILEISALSRRNGYCYATKGYIAKATDTSFRTIENTLRKMEEYGMAERIFTNKLVDKDGKEHTGTFQRIYWKQQPFEEGVSQNYQGGFGKKVLGGVGEISQDKTEYNKQSNISYKDIGVNTPKGKGSHGNKDIQTLKSYLIQNYPKTLEGIGDTRKLWNTVQVLHPRKGKDGWMSSDWEGNLKKFLSVYLSSTEGTYLVGSMDKLREKAKVWREYGGKLDGGKSSPKYVYK